MVATYVQKLQFHGMAFFIPDLKSFRQNAIIRSQPNPAAYDGRLVGSVGCGFSSSSSIHIIFNLIITRLHYVG